jgi:hypothetical protein
MRRRSWAFLGLILILSLTAYGLYERIAWRTIDRPDLGLLHLSVPVAWTLRVSTSSWENSPGTLLTFNSQRDFIMLITVNTVAGGYSPAPPARKLTIGGSAATLVCQEPSPHDGGGIEIVATTTLHSYTIFLFSVPQASDAAKVAIARTCGTGVLEEPLKRIVSGLRLL